MKLKKNILQKKKMKLCKKDFSIQSRHPERVRERERDWKRNWLMNRITKKKKKKDKVVVKLFFGCCNPLHPLLLPLPVGESERSRGERGGREMGVHCMKM